MLRILTFLAFFSYLNVLCFDVHTSGDRWGAPVASGEALVEVMLDDLLDLEQSQDVDLEPTAFFEDYRADQAEFDLMPIILVLGCVFGLLLQQVAKSNKPRFFYSSFIERPGYYNFLYRYRLF